MSTEVMIVKGFVETSFIDWPGRVAAVIFLPGCNFRCPFCHNAELVLTPGSIKDIPISSVLTSLRDHNGWIDGVVVTGGEPTISSSLPTILRILKDEGLAVKLDTNGSNPALVAELIAGGLVAAVSMDIKAALEKASYRAATGIQVDMGAIRESIRILATTGIEAECRTTVVPGLHDEGSLRAIISELRGLPLRLQNFRPADVLDESFRLKKPFTDEEFARLQELVRRIGRLAK